MGALAQKLARKRPIAPSPRQSQQRGGTVLIAVAGAQALEARTAEETSGRAQLKAAAEKDRVERAAAKLRDAAQSAVLAKAAAEASKQRAASKAAVAKETASLLHPSQLEPAATSSRAPRRDEEQCGNMDSHGQAMTDMGSHHRDEDECEVMLHARACNCVVGVARVCEEGRGKGVGVSYAPIRSPCARSVCSSCAGYRRQSVTSDSDADSEGDPPAEISGDDSDESEVDSEGEVPVVITSRSLRRPGASGCTGPRRREQIPPGKPRLSLWRTRFYSVLY